MTKPHPARRDDVETAYAALMRHWPRLRGWLRDDQALALWREALPVWERQGREDDLAAVRRRVRRLAARRPSTITRRVRGTLPGAPLHPDGDAVSATAGERGVPDGEVEVAHEALIRHWPRLRKWLEEDRAALLLRDSVREAAQEWERNEHDEGFLAHRGRRLEQAEALAHHPRLGLNEQERAYLDAALALREREAQEREAQRLRELAAQRERAELAEAARNEAEQRVAEQAEAARGLRRRLLVAVGAVGLAVAAALLAVKYLNDAEWERDRAVTAQMAAEEQASIALSRQLVAQAREQVDGAFDLAILLGLEASKESDTVEARALMLDLLSSHPHLVGVLRSLDRLGSVSSVAFSPDGALLASASSRPDGTIVLWDMARRQPRGDPLTGHGEGVLSVAFSPDGTLLASGSYDRTIVLWDVASGQRLGPQLLGHEGFVHSVAFSPDGATLASGSDDGTIILWDVASRQRLGDPLVGHRGAVTTVAFSPDGTLLATGSDVGAVILWDVATRQPFTDRLVRGEGGYRVNSLAFSPDGTILAAGNGAGVTGAADTGSQNDSVVLWDVASREPIGAPMVGHDDWVQSVAFSPDGTMVASGGGDGTVIIWDAESQVRIGSPLTGHGGTVDSVAFSPGGATLATGHSDATVVLWDLNRGHLLNTRLDGPDFAANGVAFSADGTLLASGGDTHRPDPDNPTGLSIQDGTIVLWDSAGYRPLGEPLVTPDSTVESIAFSPDGKTIAIEGLVPRARPAIGESQDNGVHRDNAVTLWDVASRRPRRNPLIGDGFTVSDVVFSPDGAIVAIGGSGNAIILWDVASGRSLGTLRAGDKNDVRGIAFSPDGTTMAAAGCGELGYQSDCLFGEVRFWDVVSLQPLGDPLVAHRNAVTSVAFNPDGTLLATGSIDGTVILWDTATRSRLGAPLAHTFSAVDSVAFSPDRTTLISVVGDAIYLWHVASRQPIGLLTAGSGAYVHGVAFSPDGTILATSENCPSGNVRASCTQGEVRLWDMDRASWLAKACDLAGRNLTPEEWQRYIGDASPHRATCPEFPMAMYPAVATPAGDT